MKKTFVLTSFVALAIATHATNAMADYTENSQYGETCSVGNIGAYDSSTSIAVAHFAPTTYPCPAGTYLPANEDSCTACPAGSFCGGGSYTFDSVTQGSDSCPAGYTNSDSGSSLQTECYTPCTTAMFTHSTGVTGRDYYGNATDTCVITGCDSGYHVDSGAPAPNLTELIGVTGEAAALGWILHNGEFESFEGNNSQQAYSVNTADSFGISGNDAWAVDYGSGKGMITGKTICSTQVGNADIIENNNNLTFVTTTFNSLTADFENGQYCYCQIDSYTPSGGTKQSLSAPWVFLQNSVSASGCARTCVDNCAAYLDAPGPEYAAIRTALFNSVTPTAPSCVANTITVRWGDGNGGVHDSTQCTYGGTLYTPTTAPTAPKGHHFTGWTFDLGNN